MEIRAFAAAAPAPPRSVARLLPFAGRFDGGRRAPARTTKRGARSETGPGPRRMLGLPCEGHGDGSSNGQPEGATEPPCDPSRSRGPGPRCDDRRRVPNLHRAHVSLQMVPATAVPTATRVPLLLRAEAVFPNTAFHRSHHTGDPKVPKRARPLMVPIPAGRDTGSESGDPGVSRAVRSVVRALRLHGVVLRVRSRWDSTPGAVGRPGTGFRRSRAGGQVRGTGVPVTDQQSFHPRRNRTRSRGAPRTTDPMLVGLWTTFGSSAARRGPVALRPGLAPGLPLSCRRRSASG